MSWLDPQRYSLPVVISVALHALVAGLFLLAPATEQHIPEPVPQHVIANVVQVENAAQKERKIQAEKERKRKEAAAKREAERKKQLAEQKRRDKEKAQRLAEQKKRDQEKALKEKKQADQKAKEKAARDKAAAEQLAREQAAQEQALLKQLAAEQAAEEKRAEQQAIKQAEEAAALKADAVDQIRSKVESVWRYPPAVRPDQEVGVHITLVPTGQVIDVRIIQRSGNDALDRSVEQAVRKASPLPVPRDPRVFEQSFRNFTIKFRPENATW